MYEANWKNHGQKAKFLFRCLARSDLCSTDGLELHAHMRAHVFQTIQAKFKNWRWLQQDIHDGLVSNHKADNLLIKVKQFPSFCAPNWNVE